MKLRFVSALILVGCALILLVSGGISAPTANPSTSPSRQPSRRPSKAPSRTPSRPTNKPSRVPSTTPTRSPIKLSQLALIPTTLTSFVVIKNTKTETLTITYNNAVAQGKTVVVQRLNSVDPVVPTIRRGANAAFVASSTELFTSSFDFDVTIATASLDPNVAEYRTTLQMDMFLQQDTSLRFNNVTVVIVVKILTAIVFPDGLSYAISGGTAPAVNTLNPRSLIQVFNSLCNSTVIYTVLSGCDSLGGLTPMPSWLGFDTANLLTQPFTIEAGRGLPDEINFGLNFTEISANATAPKAETFQHCLTFNLNLVSFGLSLNKTVLISVTTLRPCPAGTSSSSGDDLNGCQQCLEGQYQPSEGSTSCLNCPESFPQTTAKGSKELASCVTATTNFNNNGTRAPCPIGANCTAIGITLETLVLKSGFWRPKPTSLDIRKCVRPQYCIGGAFPNATNTTRRLLLGNGRRRLDDVPLSNGSALCRQYHQGVMCFGCVPGTTKRTAEKICQVCDPDSLLNDSLRMGGIIFALVLLVIGLVAAFCIHSKHQMRLAEQEEIRKREAELAAAGLGNTTAVVTSTRKSTQEFVVQSLTPAGGDTDEKGGDADKPKRNKVPPNALANKPASNLMLKFFDTVDITVQLKIIIGLFQVIGGMSIAFNESLPDFFKTVTVALSLLSFDLFTVFDFGCAVSDQSHYASLLVSTIVPLGLIVVVIVIDWILRVTLFKKQPESLKELNIISYTVVLLILFLIYPSVSSTILKTYDCRRFGDDLVLGADLSIPCDDDRYYLFSIYAGVFLCLYVVGIPLYYAALLWSQRERINLDPSGFVNRHEYLRYRDSQESIAYLRFLWKPYVPRSYMFEVYELFRKLAQTSILVFVAPGTTIQMCFQLAITALSVIVLHVFLPYQRAGNQVLALVSQWVIFMITFISLLIKVGQLIIQVQSQFSIAVTETYDVQALSVVLLVLLIVAPAVAVIDMLNQLLENNLYKRVFFCFNWNRCCWGRFAAKARAKFSKSGKTLTSTTGSAEEQPSFVALLAVHSSHELAKRADIAVKVREEEIHELHQKQRDAQKTIEDLHTKLTKLEQIAEEARQRTGSIQPAIPFGPLGTSMRRLQQMGASFNMGRDRTKSRVETEGGG